MSFIYIPPTGGKIDLSAYATKTLLTGQLASYATTTQLASYATTSLLTSQLLDKATVSQPVTFNGITSTASLKVNQQLVMNVTTITTTSYTTLLTDYCILCSNINPTTITLTTPLAGTIVRIKVKSGTNRLITITPISTSIDGSPSIGLPYARLRLHRALIRQVELADNINISRQASRFWLQCRGNLSLFRGSKGHSPLPINICYSKNDFCYM
jgi:hypothetical protein